MIRTYALGSCRSHFGRLSLLRKMRRGQWNHTTVYTPVRPFSAVRKEGALLRSALLATLLALCRMDAPVHMATDRLLECGWPCDGKGDGRWHRITHTLRTTAGPWERQAWRRGRYSWLFCITALPLCLSLYLTGRFEREMSGGCKVDHPGWGGV